MTETSTLRMRLSRWVILLIILVGFIGFFSGMLTRLMPCPHCERAVLILRGQKVFGEHRIYCPLADR